MRIAAVCLVGLIALGCAADPRTQVITDAGKGAVAGGLLGGLVGGREGAWIGGALGGLSGGLAGIYLRSHSADQEQLVSMGGEYAEAYEKAQEVDEPQIIFISAEAHPDIVFPGGNVELVVVYRVIAPGARDKLKILERRELADAEGTRLWAGDTDSRLRGGAYRSTQLFEVPDEAQAGNYRFHAVVKANKTEKASPNAAFHIATVPEEG